MSQRYLLATCRRVLDQLRHDARSIAMTLVLPSLLLALLYYLYEGNTRVFDRIGLILLGVFPFVMMFLVTSIAMLRERTSGTLERLLTTPINKADLLFGYGLSYSLVAAAQAIVTTIVAFQVLGLSTEGSVAFVIVIAVADAILGVALGLLSSAFARTEFQVMQMMPVVILPQFFVCGLFVPRDQMAGWLEGFSAVMPLTYAVDAMLEIGEHSGVSGVLVRDIGIVLGAAVASLALAAQTLQRRSA
jgi:ABC-2 type transport system permease protein